MHESFASGYQEEMGEVEEPEVEEENALELQSGRGEAMGSARYGVPINIVTHLTVKSLTVFRSLSDAWHRFLRLDGAAPSLVPESGSMESRFRPAEPGFRHRPTKCRDGDGGRPVDPDFGRISDPSAPSARSGVPDLGRISGSSASPAHPFDLDLGQISHLSAPPAGRAPPDRIHVAMQQLFGPGPVTFHSLAQEEAIHAVLARESPLIVVLPTGGCKTVLAMVPALLEPHSVTIFVTPFRALTDDMVHRFQRAGIDSREWRYGDCNSATVVVVSADIAASFHFLTYAQQLQQSGLLHRIFMIRVI